jgi:hypothetical protein
MGSSRTGTKRPSDSFQRDGGQTVLVLEDLGGELLGGPLGRPMEVEFSSCF